MSARIDRLAAAYPNWQPLEPIHGVVVMNGYGLRVGVERGHLIAEDGIGGERRKGRFSRLDRDLKRVVVLGHAGSITLDGIRWLHGMGIPLVHLNADGTLYFVSAPSAPCLPQVRRAQATAPIDGRALAIGQQLIQEKIEGQLRVVGALNPTKEVVGSLSGALAAIPLCRDMQQIRTVEADAARAYWSTWANIPVRLKDRDTLRRPQHWIRFGSRASPLLHGTSPRRAVTPANAILNYLYSILEAEARIAALAVGLDPYLGFVHTDRQSRDSLALDLMEPVRPAVDHWLLQLLADRVFTKEDFFELLDGGCRLMPQMTSLLTDTSPRWAQLVLPVAQKVVRALHAKEGPATVGRPRRGQRVYTREYRPKKNGKGDDPRKQPDALSRRRESMLAVKARNDQWLAAHPGDYSPERFRRQILPKLQAHNLVTIMAATGFTNGMASLVRRGRTVPHPRHWEALEELS